MSALNISFAEIEMVLNLLRWRRIMRPLIVALIVSSYINHFLPHCYGFKMLSSHTQEGLQQFWLICCCLNNRITKLFNQITILEAIYYCAFLLLLASNSLERVISSSQSNRHLQDLHPYSDAVTLVIF